MSNRTFPLEQLRIASPCPVAWDSMTGDDRVRFCAECSLNVYNISALSRAEAEAFISGTEGRICAKLYRRADGTVITRDCPVGLKTTRRRKAKVATAALAAVMTVAAGASAQDSSQPTGSGQRGVASSQTQQDNQTGLSGRIVIPTGDILPGIKVQVFNEATKRKAVAVTNDRGEFHFPFLEAGSYKLKINSKYFETHEQTNIVVRSGEATRVEINLLPKGTTVIVGIVIESKGVSISQGTTTITLPN